MLPFISMNLVIAFGKGFLVYHLAAFGPAAVERFSGNGVTGKVDVRLISTFNVHLGGVWDGGQSRILKYSLGRMSNSKKKSFH